MAKVDQIADDERHIEDEGYQEIVTDSVPSSHVLGEKSERKY